jgi:hypothetical protein
MFPDNEENPMKFSIRIALLLLVPAISTSAQAQPGRGQGEHRQAEGPAQRQARPMQQARPEQQAMPMQQRQQAQPAARQPPQHAVPAPQRANPAGRERNPGQNHGRVQPSPPSAQYRGGHEHGRISNEHYDNRFGREHSFHVNRRDYDRRRFQYGGYAFGFVDPWPINWGYSDDVYVAYADGGYYMYNRFHPGLRISINIL